MFIDLIYKYKSLIKVSDRKKQEAKQNGTEHRPLLGPTNS